MFGIGPGSGIPAVICVVTVIKFETDNASVRQTTNHYVSMEKSPVRGHGIAPPPNPQVHPRVSSPTSVTDQQTAQHWHEDTQPTSCVSCRQQTQLARLQTKSLCNIIMWLRHPILSPGLFKRNGNKTELKCERSA